MISFIFKLANFANPLSKIISFILKKDKLAKPSQKINYRSIQKIVRTWSENKPDASKSFTRSAVFHENSGFSRCLHHHADNTDQHKICRSSSKTISKNILMLLNNLANTIPDVPKSSPKTIPGRPKIIQAGAGRWRPY